MPRSRKVGFQGLFRIPVSEIKMALTENFSVNQQTKASKPPPRTGEPSSSYLDLGRLCRGLRCQDASLDVAWKGRFDCLDCCRDAGRRAIKIPLEFPVLLRKAHGHLHDGAVRRVVGNIPRNDEPGTLKDAVDCNLRM
jgi:hypothetical protein